MKRLNIIHPYGTVGRLPWLVGLEQAIPFGGSLYPEQLLKASKAIQTFGERFEDVDAVHTINFAIAEREKLFFWDSGITSKI